MRAIAERSAVCGAPEIEYAVLMAGIYWTPPAVQRGGFAVAKASR